MYRHEDNRRILLEWISDEPFCSSKVIFAKSETPIGDHYHKEKNEKFLLLLGRARKVIIGEDIFENVEAPFVFDAPKGTYHLFQLEQGSILVGVGDKKFDEKDELKL